jgi:hypothetical protein
VVRRNKPDCLVFGCRWETKLKHDKERLALAVKALKPYVGRLVILNEPPILPENASRDAIRQGARPPFFEDSDICRRRMGLNEYLKSFNCGNCLVVDIASHFQTNNGEVLFSDGLGRQLYQDSSHLSEFGADLVRSCLRQAVSPEQRPGSEEVAKIPPGP